MKHGSPGNPGGEAFQHPRRGSINIPRVWDLWGTHWGFKKGMGWGHSNINLKTTGRRRTKTKKVPTPTGTKRKQNNIEPWIFGGNMCFFDILGCTPFQQGEIFLISRHEPPWYLKVGSFSTKTKVRNPSCLATFPVVLWRVIKSTLISTTQTDLRNLH